MTCLDSIKLYIRFVRTQSKALCALHMRAAKTTITTTNENYRICTIFRLTATVFLQRERWKRRRRRMSVKVKIGNAVNDMKYIENRLESRKGRIQNKCKTRGEVEGRRERYSRCAVGNIVADRRVDFNYQMAGGCSDAPSNSLRIVRGKWLPV